MRTLLAALGMFGLTALAGEPQADLVILGHIRTMAKPGAEAEGMAVAGGRILFVGGAEQAAALLGPRGKILTLPPGAMVMPGIVDSHIHMLDAGVMQLACDVGDPKTREEMFATITDYAQKNPALAWVMGSGWPPQFFPGGTPTREELDALIPDRPAVFYGQDGHSAWLNSRALDAAGIDRNTADPPRGRIERNPKTGEPGGALREAAMDLIEAHVPKPDYATYEKGLRRAQQFLHSLGITQIQDAAVSPRLLEAYARAEKEGTLTMKVTAAQFVDPSKAGSHVLELAALRDRFSGGKLTAGSAKIFLDGVMEARTAALLQPYQNTEEFGILNWPPERLASITTELDRAGFQIHMHAIGDRAAREGLNALAIVKAVNGASDHRHHMAHLELVDPADFPRFAELGVTANFQPLWMFADESITESTEPLLGKKRTGRLYPIKSIADAGARIAAGSDWPVSSPNPFTAIQIGLTRQDPKHPDSSPWNPGQRVSLDLLLAAYTINGAWLNHRETETGSLEAGKSADFIILDRNLFAIPVQELAATRVMSTYVDGKLVYQYRPGLARHGDCLPGRKSPSRLGSACPCQRALSTRRQAPLPSLALVP